MVGEGKAGQRMEVAFEPDWCRLPDLADYLDGRPDIFKAESLSGQNLPIALRVEVGKAIREREFFSVYVDFPANSFAFK